MASKNFVQQEPTSVRNAIAAATAETPAPQPTEPQEPAAVGRKTYTKEEAQEFKRQGKTAGRKGIKGDRINLGITPDNYEYIKVMGQVTGDGPTKFINKILDQHRKGNAEIYAQALKFKEALDNYKF